MTDTNATTAVVENLTGAAREAAVKLADLGSKVYSEITVGGIAHVNATIVAIMELQPTLSRELAQCKRDNPTVEVKEGRFHKHMTALINRVGDDKVTWQLDAATTFLAASFKRDARAWSAYQNLIADTVGTPTLRAFVAFQDRYKLGHYTSRGVLTEAGKRADKDAAEDAYKEATKKVDRFKDIDWSPWLDEGQGTDEDWLAFFHELAYYAEGEVLRRERTLKGSTSGKAIVSAARDAAKKALKLR
jgi:hypothetical protein